MPKKLTQREIEAIRQAASETMALADEIELQILQQQGQLTPEVSEDLTFVRESLASLGSNQVPKLRLLDLSSEAEYT